MNISEQIGKMDIRKLGGLASLGSVTAGAVGGFAYGALSSGNRTGKQAEDYISSSMGTGANVGLLGTMGLLLAHPATRGGLRASGKAASLKLKTTRYSGVKEAYMGGSKLARESIKNNSIGAMGEQLGASGVQKFLGRKITPVAAGVAAVGLTALKKMNISGGQAANGMQGAYVGLGVAALYSSIGKDEEGAFSQIGTALGAAATGIIAGGGIGIGIGKMKTRNFSNIVKEASSSSGLKRGWYTKAVGKRKLFKDATSKANKDATMTQYKMNTGDIIDNL